MTEARPLEGATAWLITDGKAGHESQAEGVAQALGVAYEWRRVAPAGLARLLAPWGPAPRTFVAEPPWPALVIGVGRTAIPALRRVHGMAGMATFAVALQDPRTHASIADLIWVPAHDKRRGPNVITTLTSPHRFTTQLLENLRATHAADIEALPAPRVMVAVGGSSKVWRFTPQDAQRLATALSQFGSAGASFMVTTSRRTPDHVAAALRDALRPFPHAIYTGDGENPYPRYLAHADAIVVTADSVSMTGEAVAAGRPVYVFRPSGGSDKFVRFHDALAMAGATRLLVPGVTLDTSWQPRPIHAACDIARAIEQRIGNRARYVSGMMGQNTFNAGDAEARHRRKEPGGQ